MSATRAKPRSAPVQTPANPVQVWHYFPSGWPPPKGEKAFCGALSSGEPKRTPHEMCLVCAAVRGPA